MKNGNARIDPETVAKIRAEYRPGHSRDGIAKKYGLSAIHVWQIATGKWRNFD